MRVVQIPIYLSSFYFQKIQYYSRNRQLMSFKINNLKKNLHS